MSEPTTTPKKPAKLSRRQQFDNFLFQFAIVANGVIAIVWTVQMWLRSYHRWHKKHPSERFKPMVPKLVTCWVISDEPQTPALYHLLKAYHIRYLHVGDLWEIQHGHVGLTVRLLVNPSMYDQVDSILFNGTDGLWEVQSAPGKLRDVQFRPHAQTQPQQAPRQRITRQAAKLGKNYR